MGEQGTRSQPLSRDLEMPDVRSARCYVPFVRRAERELANTRQCASLLSDACVQKLLAGLLRELASCGQGVINREIAKRLETRSFLYAIDIRLAPKELIDDAESQVITLIEQSDWHALDGTAPLLRTTLTRRTERFIATTQELCERIARDRTSLQETLLGARPLGTITSIDHGGADSHDGGRRACMVSCEAGTFAYKPHDCTIDEWFRQIAGKHLPDTLRIPKTIARNDAGGAYGFCEFISRSPVPDERGIAQFWRRMGRACALFYLLGSHDLHGHNFIASAELPALVDLETVLAPEPAAQGNKHTCPNVQLSLGGFTADLAKTLVGSGIHAKFDSAQGNLSPFFARNASCLPMWNGREYDVTGFEDEVSAGFAEGCEALLANADELMHDVNSARELPVRWVVRPTDVYGKLLKRLRAADAYDVASRGRIVGALKQSFAIDGANAAFDAGEGAAGEAPTAANATATAAAGAAPTTADADATANAAAGAAPTATAATTTPTAPESLLVASEMASLLDGDVPSFRVSAGSTTIHTTHGQQIEGLLASSAVDRALARIREIGRPERTFASAVLDANLRFAEMPDEHTHLSACKPTDKPLDPAKAQAEAEAIFAKLESLSVTSPSGCTAWLFRSYSQRTLTEPGNGFANGVWGMAPFFAALAQTTHDERMRERARAHLEMCLNRMDEVLALLHDARRIPERSVPLGLTAGFGGMLRALTLVHQICESADIRGRVEHLAAEEFSRIACSDVENARYASVYSGCAGLLLALCQCPWTSDCEDAKRAVDRLAERLVGMRVLHADGGHVVWKTLEADWAISGFGNGVAGVGAALAVAAGRGANCEDDARAAFAWERSVYNDALGTWPDYRESTAGGKYVHGICSGAPGVGLAAVVAQRALRSDCAASSASLNRSTSSNRPAGPDCLASSNRPAGPDCLASSNRATSPAAPASPSHSANPELAARAGNLDDLVNLADAACSTLPPARRDTLCCGCGSTVEYWLARGRRDDAGRLLAGELNRKNAAGHYVFQGRQRRQNDDPSLFFGLSGVGYNLLRYANPSLPGIFE